MLKHAESIIERLMAPYEKQRELELVPVDEPIKITGKIKCPRPWMKYADYARRVARGKIIRAC